MSIASVILAGKTLRPICRYTALQRLDISYVRLTSTTIDVEPGKEQLFRGILLQTILYFSPSTELLDICSSCRELRSLSIRGMSKALKWDAMVSLTDDALMHLTLLTHLEYLDLKWNDDITLLGVISVVKKLPKLRCLDACMTANVLPLAGKLTGSQKTILRVLEAQLQ